MTPIMWLFEDGPAIVTLRLMTLGVVVVGIGVALLILLLT